MVLFLFSERASVHFVPLLRLLEEKIPAVLSFLRCAPPNLRLLLE